MPLLRGTRLPLLTGGVSGVTIADIMALQPHTLAVVRTVDIHTEEDGTGTVAPDGAVGYIEDLSGNGHHLTQATAGSRPLYKTSGGLHWLESDGVDDVLSVSFVLSEPFERVGAYRRLDDIINGRIFGAPNGLGSLFRAGTSQVGMYSGNIAGPRAASTIGNDEVSTERYNGATSRLAVDNGSYDVQDSGGNSPDGLSISADASAAEVCSTRFYGVVQFDRLLSDSEIALCRALMAQLQGRVL